MQEILFIKTSAKQIIDVSVQVFFRPRCPWQISIVCALTDPLSGSLAD